jgi:hypothetical protein
MSGRPPPGCALAAPSWSPAAPWSLCLPYSDSSIYAGTSAAERSRRKREALAELTRQALKGMRR